MHTSSYNIMLVLVSFLVCMGSFVSGSLILGLKEDANMMITKSCIEKESQTLLAFKADLADINKNLYDWGSKEKTDCCQWVGVVCDNHTGHVIELHLSTSSSGLSGKISPSLQLLHQLQYLDLRGTDFQFNSIPNFLSSLTNLRYLDMSAANLSGSIPHELANLSNLLHLDLSHNFLSGSIPVTLGDLTSLKHLNLSGNQLQGIIPNFFGNWSFLVNLDLSKNLLNELLPDFAGCSSIDELILDRNSAYRRDRNFTQCLSSNGSTHDCTGCLSLQRLDLSSNRLSGCLPKSVGKLSYLEYLDVSFNSLEGVISDVHFQNLTQLTYLDLSFNYIVLNLSSNGLTRSRLTTIKMQSCKLGPRFPMWIQTQRDFAYLDISNAGILDHVPAWFWDLPPGLKFLNLSSNEIKGMLPGMTSDFERYPGMDLSYNQFEGEIPPLPSKLAALNLSGNRFKGTLSFLCQIDAVLTFLDLSNNFLSGGLPDCWSKFQEKLVVLNLSNNTFSGEIPSSFGHLSQLQALYLRKNAFVGELPTSLSNCTKLRFVDLGENKLSGNIPTWIGETLSKLYVLVLRSNRFHGSIPSRICWLSNLQYLDLSKNALSGNIHRCFGNFTAMARRGFQDEIMSHYYSSYVSSLPGTTRDSITYEALNRTNIVLCSGRGGRYHSCGSNEMSIFIDNALVAWKGTEREFGKFLHLLKGIDLSSNSLSGKLPYEITSLHELVSLNFSSNKLHGEVPKHMGRLRYLQSLDLSRNEFSGNIPLSLSLLTFLSYLDLSYNNLSGRIPLGPQLQLFNSSSYTGNTQLCGPPLTERCGFSPPPAIVIVMGKEDGDDFWKSYYTGMGVGFAVGFWGICGALFLSSRCRYLVFASLSHMKDWIYITLVVHLQKLQRNLRR